MRIVDGGAKDKAICLLGGSDQLVHHVVVKGAAAIELAALATANAVANGLGAQLEHLGIDTSALSCSATSASARAVLPFALGLPLTKRTFITNSLCCW